MQLSDWWLYYEKRIKNNCSAECDTEANTLEEWQDRLFINFLIFCFPVSFIAAVPGVFMAFKERAYVIAAVDLITIASIATVTFARRIPLKAKKIIIVAAFYLLAIVLTSSLVFFGPGIFYLFALTVLIALFITIKYACWSIALNAVLLVVFALLIHFRLFSSALTDEYSTGKWLAVTSNVIFLSIVVVVLIHRIFKGLQFTINVKDQLQERYKSIFKLSPLPMWLFDVQSLRFIDVNEAAVRQYGFTKAEFIDMTIQDICPGDKMADFQDFVDVNRVSQQYYEGTAEHIKKNGTRISVKIESTPVKLDGRDLRIVLANDITEQLKNELAVFNANLKIKESVSNLQAIFNSSMEGFILLNRDGVIKTFNSKAQEHIKIGSAQKSFAVGNNIFDLVESARINDFERIVQRVLQGEIVEYDRNHHVLNQKESWLHYTLTPVYEEQAIKGFCITGRDITAAKTYIRTIEQQNKIFREISWIQSHGVRAPLARIMGLVELLEQEPDENERTELLAFLKKSSDEQDSIIRDITEKSSKELVKINLN